MFDEIRYELWKRKMTPEEREETLTFEGWKRWRKDTKQENRIISFIKWIVFPKE